MELGHLLPRSAAWILDLAQFARTPAPL